MTDPRAHGLPVYVHSGRVPAPGLVLGAFSGLLAGALLAWGYAYLLVYMPIAGYVTFVLSAAFGGLSGLATGFGLRTGRVRNVPVGVVMGVATALVVQYLAWVVWVHATLARADVTSAVVDLALAPSVLWTLVSEINRTGAWTIHGITPSGGFLWGLWAIEALIILGTAVLGAYAMVMAPFCERCQEWCEPTRGVLTTSLASDEALFATLAAHDLHRLEAFGPAPAAAPAFVRFDVHGCRACDATHTLDAVRVVRKVDRGKTHESDEPIVQDVLISAREVAALRDVAARLGHA